MPALSARSSVAALRRCAARAAAPRAAALLATRAAAGDAPRKLVLITGANTGLGKQAALELSRDHGFEVVGACRSLERGEAAAAAIAAAGGSLTVMELDLASFASIRRFAEAFTSTYGRCDVLLNNAGIMVRCDAWRALALAL
jgi:NAD(P)-dependent dehydrogenase (short-subunit alcohol dehydrogenase family)